MNSTPLNLTRFKSTGIAGQIRRAVGLLKTEEKVIKLKVQFDRETGFSQPIRRTTRTPAQWSPNIRVSLRALAMAGQPKPIKPELTGGIFPEDSSP